MVALRAVAAADTLGSPDGLLSRVQQTVQHLTDHAVFAVERIGVHDRSSSRILGHEIWASPRIRVGSFSRRSKGPASW